MGKERGGWEGRWWVGRGGGGRDNGLRGNRLRGIVELSCGSQMTIGAVWGKGTRYENLGLWKLR